MTSSPLVAASRIVSAAFRHLSQLAAALFLLILTIYVWREIRRDVVVIDPFKVPHSFEEVGLTSEVVSSRIEDALHDIRTEANSTFKTDDVVQLEDLAATPDVDIPGTSFGLKTVVDMVRDLFSIYPQHVGGHIVVANGEAGDKSRMTAAKSASEAGPAYVSTTIYISRGRSRISLPPHTLVLNDINQLPQQLAEEIEEQMSPYLLAVYEFKFNHPERARDLAERLIYSPFTERALKANAYTLLGNIARSQKDPDQAIADYQKAIELDSRFTNAYINWAAVLWQDRGDYEAARQKYDLAIRMEPKRAVSHFNLGLMLATHNQIKEAVDEYRAAIAEDPHFALTYAALGDVDRRQSHFDAALAEYQTALSLDPHLEVASDGLEIVRKARVSANAVNFSTAAPGH